MGIKDEISRAVPVRRGPEAGLADQRRLAGPRPLADLAALADLGPVPVDLGQVLVDPPVAHDVEVQDDLVALAPDLAALALDLVALALDLVALAPDLVVALADLDLVALAVVAVTSADAWPGPERRPSRPFVAVVEIVAASVAD